jgi:hypothetical protein
MTIEIMKHEIEYSWSDGRKREMDDTDIEHVRGLIGDPDGGCSSGELCQARKRGNGEFFGWWEIKKPSKTELSAHEIFYWLSEAEKFIRGIRKLTSEQEERRAKIMSAISSIRLDVNTNRTRRKPRGQ